MKNKKTPYSNDQIIKNLNKVSRLMKSLRNTQKERIAYLRLILSTLMLILVMVVSVFMQVVEK